MRLSFSIIYQSLAHVVNLDQRNSFVNPLVLAHPDNFVAWDTRQLLGFASLYPTLFILIFKTAATKPVQ